MDEIDHDELLDFGFGISVHLAPSDEQINEKGHPEDWDRYLPDGRRIYLDEMDATPEWLCVEKNSGWEKMICIRKDDFPQLMSIWYPAGLSTWDWEKAISVIDGDLVWIYGWGD